MHERESVCVYVARECVFVGVRESVCKCNREKERERERMREGCYDMIVKKSSISFGLMRFYD